ncbi:MAG: type II toxin-antitoxin system VapC family toxin [Patulibacter sp.]|nr:type II toxin-antitoxin system VapC family toxin [Patulibacter sp.]
MVVLDTHAWLWWLVDPQRLSPAARDAIEVADEIGIASISGWEIAMLAERGRIALDRPVGRWVRDGLSADPRIVELPLTSAVAVRAVGLGSEGMHGDPADRVLYATARDRNAPLVTRDEALRAFDPDGTLW